MRTFVVGIGKPLTDTSTTIYYVFFLMPFEAFLNRALAYYGVFKKYQFPRAVIFGNGTFSGNRFRFCEPFIRMF